MHDSGSPLPGGALGVGALRSVSWDAEGLSCPAVAAVRGAGHGLGGSQGRGGMGSLQEQPAGGCLRRRLGVCSHAPVGMGRGMLTSSSPRPLPQRRPSGCDSRHSCGQRSHLCEVAEGFPRHEAGIRGSERRGPPPRRVPEADMGRPGQHRFCVALCLPGAFSTVVQRGHIMAG